MNDSCKAISLPGGAPVTDEDREAQFSEDQVEEVQLVDEIDDVEVLREALIKEREKSEHLLASWQRSQADFANFKKRVEQERIENAKFVNALLMASLLPILDDLERALDSVEPELAGCSWVDGIGLIYRKFLTTLESQGLSRIEVHGQDFDPNFHQAVLHEDGEEGKVIDELQRGYMLHDRLLRPAMVKVGKGKEETDSKMDG